MEALQQLEYALKHRDEDETLKDIFTEQELPPSLAERDARYYFYSHVLEKCRIPLTDGFTISASCGNDRCLFTTSMGIYPDPGSIRFNSNEITSIRQWDAQFEEFDVPYDQNWQSANAYHLAVDQDLSTCWNSHQRRLTWYHRRLSMLTLTDAFRTQNRWLLWTQRDRHHPRQAIVYTY